MTVRYRERMETTGSPLVYGGIAVVGFAVENGGVASDEVDGNRFHLSSLIFFAIFCN